MKADSFKVKEAFYTLQGEGARAGRASVFIRFSKCNLWNGKESGREAALCQFCDTDITGTDGENGGIYSQAQLMQLALDLWPQNKPGKPYVVFTGGEPALQLTESLVKEFQQNNFECAVESNGTLALPKNLDWVCISPKGTSKVIIEQCNELKLVYPQTDLKPEDVMHIKAEYYYLSPMADYGVHNSGMIIRENMTAATQFCMENPIWRMSLQTHKLLGIA
ncbi:7-carboxy-7-deazaguanine synthase [Bermanella sp. WJH001]|uniref:7-carboxy-7-deazaguanine synthase n=1 Tax=Bermanella sp. WJH001 TaxID=3048005 RepID=UPI0024BE6DFF|nr:7-carboxy-7-deazaguanine synthase [Bermanella sp. WJH001]MDJ1539898.1 7-carboxy-7-deazaguanine synthase [Bermanella sp. WJH001]